MLDITPAGGLCAGTWNRNSGGGIPDYTYCSFPNPLPSTGGLPYSIAYITATADSVTSNPVAVYVHSPISSISLVTGSASSSTPQQCFSQNQQAQLDAQECYVSNGTQYELCAPPSVSQANFVCKGGTAPGVNPNIVARGSFIAPSVGANGSVTGSIYLSGATATGNAGQTCKVANFNNGSVGATATVTLTGSNAIAAGTPLIMTSGGAGATAPPTQATLSNGSATCSGTIQLSPIFGSAGETCNLGYFNNGSTGAIASVALSGANTIAGGTALTIMSGGVNAAAPPTSATFSPGGSATCSGMASITTTLTPVPGCTSSTGTLSFFSGNSAVATINSTTNVITAKQPGTTVISAAISQTASSAGYFSTCPPKSISIALANGATKGVIAQGTPQNLTSTVVDTQGNTITGVQLDYESTNPVDVGVGAGGAGTISASFPGVATLTAFCKPPFCNPSPINEIGLNGTGLSIPSNPVDVIVPGTTSDFVWAAAPGQSQYFYSVELLTGTPGSTVRLPFVPNSMVMDELGLNLYFGSARELMIYSANSNSLNRVDTSVPGVVLAASPNGNALLINDQVRGLFYLYNISGTVASSFGGLGVSAAWTQDSNTLYIVDSAAANNPAQGITGHTNTLYVHDAYSGWSTYDLTASGGAQNLAITVPGLGAWLSGNPTVAHTWCPSGTVGNNATIQFYPQPLTDSLNIPTSAIGATGDGQHILGAALNGSSITLNDIGLNIPPSLAYPAAECPVTTAGATQTLGPLSTNPTPIGSVNLTGVTDATAVNQVVTGTAPATASTTNAASIGFVTYNTPSTSTTAAQLPYYLPQANGVGPVSYVTFADSTSATPPTAPLTGTFSPDHSIFFVSTAGDNELHFISIPPNLSISAPPTDTQQLSPALPACTPVSAGGNDAGCTNPIVPAPNAVVPATVITVKPRAVT